MVDSREEGRAIATRVKEGGSTRNGEGKGRRRASGWGGGGDRWEGVRGSPWKAKG